MASDYGLNFGFRRSDESSRVSEGRLKTPAATAYLLGSCVELDPATPGYLQQAAANAAARTGICGMLLQEEIWDRSIYEFDRVDSYSLGVAKADRLSVITNGAGTKVWFQNTDAETRADGRSIDAVTIVDFVNDGAGAANVPAVGDQLGWSGTTWVVVDGVTITNAHFEITEVDATNEYLEAVCLA